MTRTLCIAALSLTVFASTAHAEPVQITIAPPAEATTMDPGRSTQVLTVNYFVNLYDTLTRWDASLKLQPGLAIAWRNVNDTAWEFTLRQGVRFHDGSPLNSLMLINPQSTLLDADGSLWRLFHPNGFGGKYWPGNQPGQRFHELMEQARYSLDPAKRRQLYAGATAIIHEEKPWLELFQEVVVYGVAKRLQFKPRADYRLIVSEMTVSR